MDLLKDITRELRGDDESTRGDDRTGRASRGDAVDSSTADDHDERSSGDDSPGTDPRRDAANHDSPSDASPNGDSPNDGTARDPPGSDVHVCSFCETEFDADRRACPECDAELVLRGER